MAAIDALLTPLYRSVGPDLGAATVLLALALLSADTGNAVSTAGDVAGVTGLAESVVRHRLGKVRSLGLINGSLGTYRLSPDGRRTLGNLWAATASRLLAARAFPPADQEKQRPALTLIRSSNS